MTSIDTITDLMPPPDDPVEAKANNWPAVEGQLGVRLPEVYKQYVETYGTGNVGGFLWVLNPFSAVTTLNVDQMLYYRKTYLTMKAEFPRNYPRPDFPASGSFLTWAATDNGDSVIWELSNSDPDDWKVAIQSSDQGEEERTGLNTGEFMQALLQGDLASDILPRSFLEGPRAFKPFEKDK